METTIIVGVYNNKDYITETINSIKYQIYTDWNCIIVDNDSPDNSYEFIQEQIENDTRFRCFKKKNEGPSSCRNFGVSKINTNPKYIHFLDGDDFLDRAFLSTMCSYLDNHPHVGLVGCQYNRIDSNSNFIKKGIRSRVTKNRLGFPSYLKPNQYNTPFVTFFSSTGMGPFAVFRARIFSKTNGYDTGFWSHEDTDIFCQMALLAKVHYLPFHLYNKREHENNLTYADTNNHDKFRNKWDNLVSEDNILNNEIEQSLKYYYCVHSPSRDFIVALYTIMMLLKEKKTPGQINWIKELFKSSFDNFIFRKRYKEIMLNRKSL